MEDPSHLELAEHHFRLEEPIVVLGHTDASPIVMHGPSRGGQDVQTAIKFGPFGLGMIDKKY